MFYTTEAPAFSIELSLIDAYETAPAESQPEHKASGNGWIGFAILATLLLTGFGALTFGTVKLAEGVVLSQQNALESMLVR